MNQNKEGARWIAVICLCLAALLFSLRMVLIWRDVDVSTGLFHGGASTLCMVYNGVGTALLVGALVAASVVRRLRKKNGEESVPEAPVQPDVNQDEPLFSEVMEPNQPAVPVREASDDLKTATTWEGTLSAFSYLLPGFGFLFFALSFVLQGNKDALTLLFCLVSAACGGYFLLMGFRNKTDRNVPLAFFGLIPALWATLRMIIEYRDVDKYANRGMYTANLIFLVCVVCFFIYQAQVALGNKTYAMPLSWFASALLVVIFGLSARIPQLLGLLFDRLGTMDLVDAASLLLDLSITLFAALKIRRMLR